MLNHSRHAIARRAYLADRNRDRRNALIAFGLILACNAASLALVFYLF